MSRYITEKSLDRYKNHLRQEEKAPGTIRKYLSDLQKLMRYAGGQEITKELMIRYKEHLQAQQYKAASINSYLVAANRFFAYMGWHGLNVKTLKVQSETFCPEERELTRAEYKRLAEAARRSGKIRLAMILQTICATGIRVSELSAVTVRGVRHGILRVNNKGKIRTVLLDRNLQKQLLVYIARSGVRHGAVFCTKSGRPVHRNNIWRDMKKLCGSARVNPAKVYPHNLRHLFARSFYAVKKDLSGLADILGHSSIETTRIYLRASSREYQKQLDSMRLVVLEL